jgi:hypothetical protein
MVTATTASCALCVCARAATIADWSPAQDWLTVEGCTCGGFFVWKGVWEFRIPNLTEGERQDLAVRVRSVRAKDREAWISTADGTLTGPLVIQADRPAPST